MKSVEHRNVIVAAEGVIAYEAESAGVFPCVIIKGGCDYAGSFEI